MKRSTFVRAAWAVLISLVLLTGPTAAQTPDPTTVSPNSNASPLLLRQARFVPAPDAGAIAGSVQHRRVGSSEILHFTPDFVTPAGLDLEIVLAGISPAPEELAAADSLGPLTSTTGVQEYGVPADLPFESVVLYDRQLGRALSIASLGPEPACEEVTERGRLALSTPATAPDSCLPIHTVAQLNLTGTPPESVDPVSYRLEVTGAVNQPLSLSIDDILALPSESSVDLLICSGVFADVAEWTGVPLSTVLEQAGVSPEYRAVKVKGMDGFYSILNRDEVDPEDVILVYLVNGESLPLEHGYPIRIVVKRGYGSKWVKWVNTIEVLGD